MRNLSSESVNKLMRSWNQLEVMTNISNSFAHVCGTIPIPAYLSSSNSLDIHIEFQRRLGDKLIFISVKESYSILDLQLLVWGQRS